MCKILILQTSPKSPKARRKLIASAWSYFARTGEDDGFGAAWVSNTGLLSWLKSSSPMVTSRPLPDYVDGFRGSAHADLPGDGGWLLLHGRRATCGVSLDNTHPMLDHGAAALIHNGVVRSERFHNLTTSCDSELLLRAVDQEGIRGLADVSGYYAFGLLRKRRDGWHCTVARDDSAKLRVGRLPGDRGAAFGTTDEALALAGAVPVGDHKPMLAVTWAPDGTYDLEKIPAKPIVVKRDDDVESLWGVASGRVHYSSLVGRAGK